MAIRFASGAIPEGILLPFPPTAIPATWVPCSQPAVPEHGLAAPTIGLLVGDITAPGGHEELKQASAIVFFVDPRMR